MNTRYIEYKTNLDFEEDVIARNTFEELERCKHCIDWYHISNKITEETCTEDFCNTFEDCLNWQGGYFIKYLSEDYLLTKVDKIRYGHLWSSKQYSEDFCRKCVDYKRLKREN